MRPCTNAYRISIRMCGDCPHFRCQWICEYVWVQYKSLVLFKMHYNAESKSNTASMCGRIHSQSHKFFICVDHHRWQTTVAVAADTSTIVVAHAIVCLPFASSVKKKINEKVLFCSSTSVDVFGHFRVDERRTNAEWCSVERQHNECASYIQLPKKNHIFFFFQLSTISKQGTVYDKCWCDCVRRPIA